MDIYHVFNELTRIVVWSCPAAFIAGWIISRRTGSWSSTAVVSCQALGFFLLALGMLTRLLSSPLDQQNRFDVFSIVGALSLFLLLGLFAYFRRQSGRHVKRASHAEPRAHTTPTI